MRKYIVVYYCILFTIFVSPLSLAVVPKIEGRYIELQDTYTSPIWTKINFQQQYITPPAVFMLSTNQGGNPAIVKVRNVTTTSFEALPLEPSGEDGAHITMGAHYLAVEYGVHEFPDGTIMEVGKTALDATALQYGDKSGFSPLPKGYKNISFTHTFSQRPNFFHGLQTLNNINSNPPLEALVPFFTVAVQSGSLTTQQVNIALEASETIRGDILADETVAYLVVEPGFNRSFIDDNGVEVIWESFFTDFKVDGWNDGCNYFYFNNDYDVAPLVVASKNSREDSDGGWLRSCNLRTDRLGIVVDEDRSSDNERNHKTFEEASILAMTSTFVSNGDILSCDTLFPGAIATYDNGEIFLVDGVQITDNNGPLLTTTTLQVPPFGANPQCNGQGCLANGDNALDESQASQVPTVTNDGSSQGAVPASLAGDYFYNEIVLNMLEPEYVVTEPTRIFLKNTQTLLGGNSTNLGSYLNIGQTNIVLQEGAYLAIYVDGDVAIAANANIASFIVATGEVRIAKEVTYTGSITSGSQIITEGSSRFTASEVPDYIPGFCGIYIPTTLDHYRITLSDNKGLTCQAKEMTLTACSNDACSLVYDEPASLDLSPDNNGKQQWVSGENITFTGSTELAFAKRTTGTVALGYNSADPSAPMRCYIGGVDVGLSNCKVVFSDAGFIFKNDTDNNTTIATQLSGKPSDTGFNAASLAIQAVKTNTTTGACEAAFPVGLEVPLQLAYSCGASSSCSEPVTLSNNGTNYSIEQAYKTVNLQFDADSKAPIVLQYPDAGQLSLNVSATIVLDPVSNLSVAMTGSSNEYVVKPFGLSMEIGSNGVADDANGSLFKLTGEPFDLTLHAVQWSAGQDNDSNGYPDDYSQIHSNLIAQHFINEYPQVTPSLNTPAAGALGQLTPEYVAPFGDTGIQSESISKYHYDNVGIIDLTASLQDGDYLGAGDVRGELKNVGRFAPSQFQLHGIQAQGSCTEYGSNLTYLDQPFELGFTVQALNHKNQLMSNYNQGFAKSLVNIYAENSQVGNYVSGDEFSSRLINLGSQNWGDVNNGEYYVQQSNVQLTRLAIDQPDGPFNMVNLMATLTNIEGATLLGANDLPNSEVSCVNNCDSVRLNSVPITFRFGRLVLGNNTGSDLDNLQVPMQAQYWDGTGFVRNSEDYCTSFEHTKVAQISPNSPILNYQYGTGSSGILEAGGYPVDNAIYAIGNGAGEYILQYDTDNWLHWDWLGDGTHIDPRAVLQFGQFRGNDRVIYWRETRE
ncbi:agglutinin biogenesis protein MshQ [Pseudoalteromonas sp. MMG010]|uniref:H-type lectin domain-containing protein n=1 Tax=Pseudoalteromonas sp. MMG010 TaxID=2822685 RepID=UPI001B3A600C|nr:H-type lectin domain-containing protein [Pseudoalteromonas sp. MMG010]MBQ4832661.1 agglutinin biogenesis protein MshQ [Pseudoalteromonas sp. MMG010]